MRIIDGSSDLYGVVLSDSHGDSGDRILANLKKTSDYYSRQQRTVGDFFRDVGEKGLAATVQDRLDWGSMRMLATDVADVQGYTLLVNGKNPDQNWTGLFTPGERVRLRFVNASAMTYFDVRIPGLDLLVVQADGNNVQPVKVDEFRIAVAETYDVIVRPTEDQAYTMFAESMDRAGYARATLAPREGMQAAVPALRRPDLLTMADMGMAHEGMAGMDHSAMAGMGSMQGMDHSNMANMAGMDHSKMAMGDEPDPFYAPGSGLTPKAADGGKFLSYAALRAQKRSKSTRLNSRPQCAPR